jgi:tRNA(Ile)-lysidine synthase
MVTIKEFMNHWCKRAETTAVAVSGGADSMCLVRLASTWCWENGVECIALIVDHGLRPESHKEALEVQGFLCKQNIKAEILRWNEQKPTRNIQHTARKARYQLLTDFCHAHGIKQLLVAHNQNDQAETVIMRILRGSGIKGISAMQAATRMHNITILRPLLNVQRTQIERHLRSIGWPCVWDPSNNNLVFDRIKARSILGSCQQMYQNTDVVGRLAAVAHNAARTETFISQHVETVWQQVVKSIEPDRLEIDNSIYNLHEEIILRLLVKMIRHFSRVKAPKIDALLSMKTALCSKNITQYQSVGCTFYKQKHTTIVSL